MENIKMELAKISTNNIEWGFEQKKSELSSWLSNFDNLVVNEDNLKDMSASQREIASLRIKLDKFRKETKKTYDMPLKVFEGQVKELLTMVSNVEEPLKDQLDKYEIDRKNKLSTEITKKAKEYAESIGVREQFMFEFVIDQSWLNKNTSKSNINKGIIDAVAEVLQKQKLYDEREQMYQMRKEQIEMYCENFSEKYSLNTPLELKDVGYKTKGAELTELKDIIEQVAKERAEIEFNMAQAIKPVEEQPQQEQPQPIEVEKTDVLFTSTIKCTGITQAQLNQVLSVLENMNIEFTHEEGM